jgi:hypothetical protein
MKKSAIDHFIITRFNCELNISKHSLCLDLEWLKHRIDIFEKICFPSVKSQSSKNFKWLVLLHANSPQWLVDRFQKLTLKLSNLEAVYIGEKLSRRLVQELVSIRRNPKAPHLLTTRLDSDDGLATSFVKEIQKNLTLSPLPYLLNFSSGLIKFGNNLYQHQELSSSFLTLCEPSSDNVLTVLGKNHNKWAPEFKIHQMSLKQAWLRSVHSKSLHNTKQGKKLPATMKTPSFSIDIRRIQLLDSDAGQLSMELKNNFRALRNHVQRYFKILRLA